MPVIAELLDYDKIYEDLIDQGVTPVIINDLPCTTESDKEHIKDLTITQLSSDTINIIPTCGGACNKTKGKWALGRTCVFCGNIVKTNIDQSSQSLLWMRAPNGIEALMSGVAWKLISSYFTKNKHDALCYLTDSAYSPASKRPLEIDRLEQKGHERDLNYFIRNFDEIILDLISIFPEKNNKPYSDLRWWIAQHRHLIFSKYQPLPSKNLFITDKTILGIYMEDSIKDALDTIYHFVSIDLEFFDQSPKVVANRTARVLARQANFYHNYIATNFQPKPGNVRRGLLGSRNIFSAYVVMSSETGDHRHDELRVPWRVAVPMFQHHLMGKLMRHGFNFNEAFGYLLRHVAIYDKLIHKFLDEIFTKECPNGRGPVCLWARNPTLLPGSMQRFFMKLKTDADDPTVGMSILTVVAPNA